MDNYFVLMSNLSFIVFNPDSTEEDIKEALAEAAKISFSDKFFQQIVIDYMYVPPFREDK